MFNPPPIVCLLCVYLWLLQMHFSSKFEAYFIKLGQSQALNILRHSGSDPPPPKKKKRKKKKRYGCIRRAFSVAEQCTVTDELRLAETWTVTASIACRRQSFSCVCVCVCVQLATCVAWWTNHDIPPSLRLIIDTLLPTGIRIAFSVGANDAVGFETGRTSGLYKSCTGNPQRFFFVRPTGDPASRGMISEKLAG